MKGILPDPEGLPLRSIEGARLPRPFTEVVMADRSASASISHIGSLSDSRRAAGLIALLLGGFLVFGVGLAHSSALHDAAHDTRHSYGFPCH